jgi:hypothetical protein
MQGKRGWRGKAVLEFPIFMLFIRRMLGDVKSNGDGGGGGRPDCN